MSTRSIGEPANRDWDQSGHTEAELEFSAPGSYVFQSSGLLGTLKRINSKCDSTASKVMPTMTRFKHKSPSHGRRTALALEHTQHHKVSANSAFLLKRLSELVGTPSRELQTPPKLTESHRIQKRPASLSDERRQELYEIGQNFHRTLAAHRFNEATGGTPPPSP